MRTCGELAFPVADGAEEGKWREKKELAEKKSAAGDLGCVVVYGNSAACFAVESSLIPIDERIHHVVCFHIDFPARYKNDDQYKNGDQVAIKQRQVDLISPQNKLRNVTKKGPCDPPAEW